MLLWILDEQTHTIVGREVSHEKINNIERDEEKNAKSIGQVFAQMSNQKSISRDNRQLQMVGYDIQKILQG